MRRKPKEPAPPKTERITDRELPKCIVCKNNGRHDINAEFLALIAERIGSQIFYDWHLVCKYHRRAFLAFRLVKVRD